MQIGEIYLVNFEPSQGDEIQKVRPGIVIQSEKINSRLITIMPLSSKLKNKSKDEVVVETDDNNRLFADSVIKVNQISSFDKSRFIHFIGKIDKTILIKIQKYLIKHFDLDVT
jgi:mRNA interferase MazF